MVDQRTTPGLPTVISKLGQMTAIRDTFLVEQSLLRTLGPLLGVLETTLYRVDESGRIIRGLRHYRTAVTEADGSHQITEQIQETTHDQAVPAVVAGLLENVRLLDKPGSCKTGATFLTCYPLKGGAELCGYFLFERDHEVTPVEDATVRGVLEVFANYYALLDTSQRDRLTGLLNRYSLDLNLDRLWHLMMSLHSDERDSESRTESAAPQYWIGVLDVDHFKKINDTYGHIIGDEVLIIVTRLLESALRRSDLLYRYGGEEFIAVIVAVDAEAAAKVFERARQKIEQFQFPQVGRVTISGGFAGADPAVLPNEVINRADSAMYEAKRAGRNRVYHYDALVAQGVLRAAPSGSIELF